jgi:hypothetical protein
MTLGGKKNVSTCSVAPGPPSAGPSDGTTAETVGAAYLCVIYTYIHIREGDIIDKACNF